MMIYVIANNNIDIIYLLRPAKSMIQDISLKMHDILIVIYSY